ncbi:GtrA family protein [Hamadaea tsunoensis]|uniref:GtrA family protein n=1 Tax=Hamadaea tsunoensis TaxID=53368 RepID=UPI00040A1B76|nr:GtrA family protein [Hamadaea tsunoensis]
MRLVRFLPPRFQRLAHEIMKFGVVGVLNTLINLAVFDALLVSIADVGRLKANFVATAVATVFAYLMSRYWTFKDRPSGHSASREFLLFVFLNLIGLGIESAVIGAAVYMLDAKSILAANIAKIVGLVLGTIFRFWAYRTFVFKPSTAQIAEGEALAAAVATTGTLGVEATLAEIEQAYAAGHLTEEEFRRFAQAHSSGAV